MNSCIYMCKRTGLICLLLDIKPFSIKFELEDAVLALGIQISSIAYLTKNYVYIGKL